MGLHVIEFLKNCTYLVRICVIVLLYHLQKKVLGNALYRSKTSMMRIFYQLYSITHNVKADKNCDQNYAIQVFLP